METEIRSQKLRQLEIKPGKEFWENEGLIAVIDELAKRYGVLPTDVLNLPLYEFQMNVTIMIVAMKEETRRAEQQHGVLVKNGPRPPRDWKSSGVSYELKKG